jgi:hypothetical protein
MTREEHIENLKAMASDMPSDKCSDWIESLMAGVKALEQEPCEDAISRQAVLEAIDVKAWEFCDYLISKNRNDEQKPVSLFADNLRECISEELPPVTPAEKVGRWKRVSMDKYVQHAMAYYRCSECGGDIIGEHNYCPNCGAKMQEVEDDD